LKESEVSKNVGNRFVDGEDIRPSTTEFVKYELLQMIREALKRKGKDNIIEAQKERHGVTLSTTDKDRNHNTRKVIAELASYGITKDQSSTFQKIANFAT
jgi:predicted nucleic acid-binding protein